MCRKRYASSPASCAISGRTSSLRTSADSRPCASARRERLDRAAMEDLAFDRATLEHAPLLAVELVEPGGEQRLDRRRHDHIASRASRDHRDHLLDEERIARRPRRGSSPREPRRSSPPSVVDQLVGLRRARAARAGPWSRSAGRRPSRSAVEQLGPAEAEQQDRRAAAQVGDVLDRSRRAGSPQCMSSRTTTSGRSAAPPRGAAESPGDLLRRASALLRRARPRERAAGSRAPGRAELHDDLRHGPVGDPLAVGEAAAADDRRAEAGEELRGQARLADPGGAEQREQHAACARRPPARHASPSSRSSRCAADERRVRAGAAASPAIDGRRAGTPSTRSALPFELERLELLGGDGAAQQPASSPRRAGSRPGAAACSSRAATLTASPVASRSSVPVTTSPVLTPMRSSSRVP